MRNIFYQGIHFVIPPTQIDYSNYLAKYELLYRGTTDLSMTLEDRESFNDKLKDIALSFYKLLNDNCKYENNLSSEELSSLKPSSEIKTLSYIKLAKEKP